MATVGADVARDLALDGDGDLLLTAGDLSFLIGLEAVRSDLLARLRMFRGEWFLDITEGMPLFQDILVKRPNLAAVQAIYRKLILSVPGVAELEKLELAYEPTTRGLRIDFRARADLGELIAETVTVAI